MTFLPKSSNNKAGSTIITLSINGVEIKAKKSATIGSIRTEYLKKLGESCVFRITLYFDGFSGDEKTCNYTKTLNQLGLNKSNKVYKIRSNGLSYSKAMSYRIGGATSIFNMSDPMANASNVSRKIPIKYYHVSCESYRPTSLHGKENLAGIVLYSYEMWGNGYGWKEDWYLSGKHCKAGYIVLKRTSDIEHIKAEGMVHGAVYKSTFGRDLSSNEVIGSGFAYYKGEWTYNSWTFNGKKDAYHSNTKSMNSLESKWILRAVSNWILNYQQNTKVTESLVLLQLQQ